MPSLPRVSQLPYSNVAPQEKSYFTFVAGLNTDASPLAFPDNFSSDEENFVLDIDGSRERRKGVALEEGGSAITLDEASAGVTRCHHWRNVNGDPSLNFVVIQSGKYLFFFPDDVVITSNSMLGTLDLTSFLAPNATEELVEANPVNTDYGRGHLFVVGKYIEPFWIEWDATLAKFTATELTIVERDFEGIEDGVDLQTQPTTLTTSHEYNLLNRGWDSTKISDFFTSQTVYPAKNMIPWLGQQEIVNESTATAVEKSGIKQFSPEKLVSELWQDVSAPTGHFTRDVFNPTAVVGGEGASFAISYYSFSALTAGTQTVKVRLDSDHSIADNDSVAIDGHELTYTSIIWSWPEPREVEQSWSLDGTYTADVTARSITAATNANPAVFTSNAHGLVAGDRVTAALTGGTWNTADGVKTVGTVTANTFTLTGVDGTSLGTFTSGTATPKNFIEIQVTIPNMTWGTTPVSYGTLWTAYTTGSSTAANYRPTATAWYVGRVWYAGCHNPKNAHKIYFSQIVENNNQYGRCYQQADPTSEHISDLIDTDGGVLVIPEIDTVRELMAYNGRLLVFADNGVWEIAGGERGYFTATGYSIRQISNTGCTSAFSVVVAEGTPYFWGDGALYAILQDPNLGFLYTQDITTGRIQKLLNGLSKTTKEQVQAAVDRNSQKVYWLYDSANSGGWKYDSWLVMDLRLERAFSKFTFKGSGYDLYSIYDIENYQTASLDYRNIKFIAFNTARTVLYISELNDATFQDFGTDAAAFLETGNDSMGDATRRRYGRYLYVYMERTETATIDNPSECFARYLWNWVDSGTTSSAWNNPYSVYRRWMRKYRTPVIPDDPADVWGEPIVTSKTKIRGSGKVLRLRFETAASKPCHIYGWHLRQDFTREA